MRVNQRKSLVATLALLFLLGRAIPQNAGVNLGGMPQPLGDSLRGRGIDVSEPSLVAALRNIDPEVRSLAALKLAEDRYLDAVPAIEEALSLEKDSKSRIAIAEALWGLHDPKGLVSLQGMCADNALPVYVLVDVVRHLNMIAESSGMCVDPILSYVDSTTERREIVLPALPAMYRWASPKQAGRILSILQDMLSDGDPYVRMEASHALVQVGAHSSVQLLVEAVSQESDPTVRASLQSDLDILKNKP